MTSSVITERPQILTDAVTTVADYLARHGVDLETIIGEAADHARSITSLVEEAADVPEHTEDP